MTIFNGSWAKVNYNGWNMIFYFYIFIFYFWRINCLKKSLWFTYNIILKKIVRLKIKARKMKFNLIGVKRMLWPEFEARLHSWPTLIWVEHLTKRSQSKPPNCSSGVVSWHTVPSPASRRAKELGIGQFCQFHC